MRFSVKYQSWTKNWAVVDNGIAQQVVGVHDSKAEAYRQAFAEQERWRKFDPVAVEMTRSRACNDHGLPVSLVVR